LIEYTIMQLSEGEAVCRVVPPPDEFIHLGVCLYVTRDVNWLVVDEQSRCCTATFGQDWTEGNEMQKMKK